MVEREKGGGVGGGGGMQIEIGSRGEGWWWKERRGWVGVECR